MVPTKIDIFRGREIRKTLHEDEWWFVLEDVIGTLTESVNPKEYIAKMKKRDPELQKGWGQIVRILDVETKGGVQNMNCANTEGVFRLIQSIPSPKVEPFKMWLAKVGYERVQEIEDPELGMKRTKALYMAKGYPDEWIEKRMRGIAVREELTLEWKNRGIKDQEYAILTGEISKATFGILPSEHKKVKNLNLENLRDHMTDLELIFSMLGERATTEITKSNNSQGFTESKQAAREGGSISGNARKALEKKTSKKIVSKKNFLQKGDAVSLIEQGEVEVEN